MQSVWPRGTRGRAARRSGSAAPWDRPPPPHARAPAIARRPWAPPGQGLSPPVGPARRAAACPALAPPGHRPAPRARQRGGAGRSGRSPYGVSARFPQPATRNEPANAPSHPLPRCRAPPGTPQPAPAAPKAPRPGGTSATRGAQPQRQRPQERAARAGGARATWRRGPIGGGGGAPKPRRAPPSPQWCRPSTRCRAPRPRRCRAAPLSARPPTWPRSRPRTRHATPRRRRPRPARPRRPRRRRRSPTRARRRAGG
jgi:hypothetical protein